MGMYDEVGFQCPKCKDFFIVQSKANECTLKQYSADDVPATIFGDLVGQKVWCDHCGCDLTIIPEVIVTTKLKLVE